MGKEEEFDIFHNQNIYEKADQIFVTDLPKIDEIKDNCIFVLDTNALLVPFSTGSESLDEIGKILKELKEKNQLKIPDQVAREFANNRPKKIGEMFQALSKKRNGINELKIGSYPLLEKMDGYQEVIEIEKQIKDILKTYRNAIGKLVDTVKSWSWDDPVSLLYRQLLTPDIIHNLQFKKDDVQEKLKYRYKHKIPPGYKDEGKEDDGIGDFLIWLSVLAIGKENQKDIVFVSGDEKTDWYHRSDNLGLYPRFELLAEFKSKCDNHSFHIIKLSDLLKLMGAKEKVVSEVKIEEQFESDLEKKRFEKPMHLIAERAVYNYYKQFYESVSLSEPVGSYCDFYYLDRKGIEIAVNVILLSESERISINRLRNMVKKILDNQNVRDKPQEIVIVFKDPNSHASKIISFANEYISATLDTLGEVNNVIVNSGIIDSKDNFIPIG